MFDNFAHLENFARDRQNQAIKSASQYRLIKRISEARRQHNNLLQQRLGRWLVNVGTRLQNPKPMIKVQPYLDTL